MSCVFPLQSLCHVCHFVSVSVCVFLRAGLTPQNVFFPSPAQLLPVSKNSQTNQTSPACSLKDLYQITRIHQIVCCRDKGIKFKNWRNLALLHTCRSLCPSTIEPTACYNSTDLPWEFVSLNSCSVQPFTLHLQKTRSPVASLSKCWDTVGVVSCNQRFNCLTTSNNGQRKEYFNW